MRYKSDYGCCLMHVHHCGMLRNIAMIKILDTASSCGRCVSALVSWPLQRVIALHHADNVGS